MAGQEGPFSAGLSCRYSVCTGKQTDYSILFMSLQALKEGEKLQDNPDYYRCGCTIVNSLQGFLVPHADPTGLHSAVCLSGLMAGAWRSPILRRSSQWCSSSILVSVIRSA